MKIAKLLLLLSMTCYTGMLHAQQAYPTVIPPSAEPAALARYADVPVSLYTGTPKIDIPLFNLQAGNLSLPISLSYYASGIRVEDVSRSVGLGWTLNAGGVVTRTIRGRYADSYVTQDPSLSIPMNPTITDFNNIVNLADNGDTEKDMFNFNFNGYSGTFYLKNGVPVLKKYDDIKITYTYSNAGILTFLITVKDGTKYYFEERSNSGWTDATEWYLTKIVNSNNTDTIYLEYTENEGDILVPPKNSKFYVFSGHNTTPYLVHNTPGLMFDYRYAGHFIKKIYNSSQDSVVFTTKSLQYDVSFNHNNRAMDRIKVYNSGGEQIKTFQLNTVTIKTLKPYSLQLSGYPLVGFTYDMNYRLYLDGITELSTSNEPLEHRFTYFGRTNDGRDSLPNSLSAAQDMGGYYNGRDTNTTLIPTFDGYLNPFGSPFLNFCIDYTYPYDLVYIPGADRSTDFNFMKMGTLKSIQYPTGGKAKFTFSQKINPSDQTLFWGMNIDKIEYLDSGGQLLKMKRYEYLSPTLGHNIPPHFTYTFNLPGTNSLSFYPACTCAPPNCVDIWRTAIELSPGHKEDLGLYEGPVIGYGLVKEIEDGNGYTLYEYSNENGYTEVLTHEIESIVHSVYPYSIVSHNTHQIGDFWPLGPFSDNSWKRGVLLSKSHYTDNAVLLKQTVYNYTFNELERLPALKIYTISPDWTYYYYQYDYILSWIRLDSTTEYADGVTLTTSFEYNSTAHKQITREVFNGSDGLTRTREYKYPNDYASSEPYTTMVSRYTISPVVEQKSINNGITTEINKTNYDFFQSYQIIEPGYSETFDGTSLERRINFHDYNSNGKLLSVSANNGPKTVYIWSYKGQYPVAEIKNAELSSVVSALGGQSAVDNFRNEAAPNVSSFLGGLRTAFPQASVTTYTYKPLVGMSSMTDPKGMTTTYEYDSFQRLKHIKDQNGNIVKSFDYHYRQ